VLAHAAIDSNNQLTWLKDSFDFEDYKLNDSRYEAIDTESKGHFAYQQKFNKKLQGADFFNNFGGAIVGGFTIIIVLVVLGMLWGKFTAPVLTAQENNNKFVALQNTQLELIKEIQTGVVDLEKSFAKHQGEIDVINEGVPPN